jgi:ABC-type phosphate/phosphonate transport system substrate-binding protein
MSRWIAALPMYNVTPEHGRLWRALLIDTLAAFSRDGGPTDIALHDEPHGDLMPLWHSNDLLLSQTCGFPYRMLGLAKTAHLIATPIFDAEGCDGPRYRSVLVVSSEAYERGATTLADCFGLRAACNSADSHSGMNALRHAVAPHARDGRFFSSVSWTGSHRDSLLALNDSRADVAAIDCVTFALLRDGWPALLRDVHVIGMTASAPGLPFIASRTLGAEQAEALRRALDTAHVSDPERARVLRLRGLARLPEAAYDEIERMANEANALGYPVLG